ncbi:hypothetical protein ACSYAD_32940 [Acaryochloris marina NIES-2412]
MIILATIAIFTAVYCNAMGATFWAVFWILVAVGAIYAEARR